MRKPHLLSTSFKSTLLVHFLGVQVILLGSISAHAELSQEVENQDRRVDQAALQEQETAAQKLKLLIVKYKGTSGEPALMMKLAEVYHQSADMEFRVAHARAFSSKKAIRLVKYNKIQASLIEITETLIRLYPEFAGIDQCMFMSAKAHEELGQKELAKEQYLRLVHEHSDSPQMISAYMALAELAIEKNQHVEAISYLTQVEKDPTSPYYPFALHKLAWSNYNLKNYELASSWIEKSVRYYDHILEPVLKKIAENPNLLEHDGTSVDSETSSGSTASDLAMRENMLMDAVLFFNDGFEANTPHYELKSALNTFRNLEKGPLLGKMNLRFAKLLRAHRKDEELIAWENQILKEEPSRPESIQVVTTLFEHLWNQGLYAPMMKVGKDLELSYKAIDLKSRETEGVASARKLLLEIANKFHETGKATTSPEKTAQILENLSGIYGIFLNVLPDNDSRAPEAHYNLAEALFLGKSYEKATDHYNWILAHFNADSRLNKKQIELKAIASRYEALRDDKLIPTSLIAKKLDLVDDFNSESVSKDSVKMNAEQRVLEKETAQLKNLPDSLRVWVGWVDAFSKKYSNSESSPNGEKENSESFENFQFEANRALYAFGFIRLATDRMLEFSKLYPQSKFTVPSMTLAMDSYILTENWEKTSALAASLLKSKKWKSSEFSNHLAEIEADSSYKIVEGLFRNQKYQDAIRETEPLIQRFKNTSRAPDFVMLMAQSELKDQQKDSAQDHLGQIIKNYPNSKASHDALLTRAQLAEQSYDFDTALGDYRAYLKTENREEIQKRVYFLEWILESNNETSNSDPAALCPQPQHNECVRYRALALLKDSPKAISLSEDTASSYLELASNGLQEDRPLFAAIALKYISDIELHKRLVLLRTLAGGWEKLDPMIRLSTLPVLTRIVPESFALARLELKRAVPMKTVTPKSITLRAEWIKDLEKTAGKILELPWNELRSKVLNELSLAYSDFTSTLVASNPPKDLSEADLKEYQKNLNDIVQPFLSKATELSEKSKKLSETQTEPVTLDYLTKLDPQTNWTIAQNHKAGAKTGSPKGDGNGDPSSLEKLKSLWLEAYSNHSWAKNAFLLQEIQEKKLVAPSLLSIMKGLTLTASGAKTEAWLEIQPVIKEISLAEELRASNEQKVRKN